VVLLRYKTWERLLKRKVAAILPLLGLHGSGPCPASPVVCASFDVVVSIHVPTALPGEFDASLTLTRPARGQRLALEERRPLWMPPPLRPPPLQTMMNLPENKSATEGACLNRLFPRYSINYKGLKI
jgi:hypothetical protein